MTIDAREIRNQLMPGLRALTERYSFGWHDWRDYGVNAPGVIDGEWTRVETPALLDRPR